MTKKILTNQVLVPSEKEIEKAIAKRLSYYQGGFVCVIELSGRPIRTPSGTVMIPFQGEFYRKGMSDIIFLYKGKSFAFEVKTEKEYKWVVKHRDRLRKSARNLLTKKRDIHVREQIDFIEGFKHSGNYGDFVCNFEQVEKIILDSTQI